MQNQNSFIAFDRFVHHSTGSLVAEFADVDKSPFNPNQI